MRKKAIPGEELQEVQHKKKKKPKKDIRWERLDNTAHLFPAIAGENMSNVYRICVTLTEPVEPEFLQQAVDMVLPKFDGFNLRMRKGVFWRYLEPNDRPGPFVQKDVRNPMQPMHYKTNNRYI